MCYHTNRKSGGEGRRLNDSQLRSFLTVADCGSFSKAEERSYMSKQALIKQLDTLESELGFRLFSRGKRGVSLTPAGEEFYQGAKKILSLYESVTEKCRELAEHRRIIRIANPPHTRLMLADAISEYAKRYPEVHQEVVFCNGAQAIEEILSGNLDVGEHVLTEEIRRSELGYTKVSSMRYFCVMAESHPLAARPELRPEELAGYTVGVMRENQREIIAMLRQHCPDIDIRGQSSGEVHMAAIYNICLNGGVYITKDYYASSLQPLRAVPLAADFTRERVLIYRKNPGEEVHRFIELVKELNQSGAV